MLRHVTILFVHSHHMLENTGDWKRSCEEVWLLSILVIWPANILSSSVKMCN